MSWRDKLDWALRALEGAEAEARSKEERARWKLRELEARLAQGDTVVVETARHELRWAREEAAAASRRVMDLEERLATARVEHMRAEHTLVAESDVNRLDGEGPETEDVAPIALTGGLTVTSRLTVIFADPPYRPSIALTRAIGWMRTAEVFVSPRVAREELGDTLENLRRFEREGRPRWHLYVHAAVGIALALWHTWGEKIAALQRRGG